MISMSLSQIEVALEGHLIGEDAVFSGVSTDTRSLRPGELFFALSGPRFDGHDMVADAMSRGAVAAVVEHQVANVSQQIVVRESRRALGRLAHVWRSHFELPLLAITGSAGKTSVKEMLGAIMRTRGPVLITAGNLNNEIGVPQTLFALCAEYTSAVIEMGASRPGDIAYLADIARPTVGVITLCAPAHLEGFGDIDTVARTKGEMISGLSADGTAIINAEDRYAPMWRELAGTRRVFMFGAGGQVRADAIVCDSQQTRFRLVCPDGHAAVSLHARGRHSINNALAAAAAAFASGVGVNDIALGLAQAQPVRGRLMPRSGIRGAKLIDDTYNANPASLQAALDLLSLEGGTKWLILGDMGELGERAEFEHRTAGSAALRAGVERLFTIGTNAQITQQAFGSGAEHFSDPRELIERVKTALLERDGTTTVLLKGSRFMALDRIADALACAEAHAC